MTFRPRIINRVAFYNITNPQKFNIVDYALNKQLWVDFSILLPIPLQQWNGKPILDSPPPFRNYRENWVMENWGTPHNAWGSHNKAHILDDARLTLTFSTTFCPPYGWLIALLNKTQLPFHHHWLNAESGIAKTGHFTPMLDTELATWNETLAQPDILDQLTTLLEKSK